MCISTFFAQVFGAYLVIASLASLLNHDRAKKVVTDALSHHGLMYFSGALSLLIGLVILVTHNVWVAHWPVLITLLGWFMVLMGAARMLFPVWMEKKIKEILTNRSYIVMCCVWLVIGLILLWAGFSN